MIDFKYLTTGLTGLGRAHVAGTMAGHLGAAVTAGYFIGEDQPELDPSVNKGIESELERIIAGEEAIWFDAKKVGVTPHELFKPFAKGEAVEESEIDRIAASLDRNIGRLRQSGHNVIFASIAIRALKDHPDLATQEVVDGIVKLIDKFQNTGGGRTYFGKETGWKQALEVTLPEEMKEPPYKTLNEMAEATFRELIKSKDIHKQGVGGMWHVINHAAGLIELHQFGYQRIAAKGLATHHHHLQIYRFLPDLTAELGELKKAEFSPTDPKYWNESLQRDQARLTHRVKTLYGFEVLARIIEDKELVRKARDAFHYLLA